MLTKEECEKAYSLLCAALMEKFYTCEGKVYEIQTRKEELDCFRQLIEEHFLNKSSIKQFRIHRIKIEPQYFEKAAADLKPWELRINDRDYKVGDILFLCEWDPEKKEFTGKSLKRKVVEVFKHLPYLPEDVVVMTIL